MMPFKKRKPLKVVSARKAGARDEGLRRIAPERTADHDGGKLQHYMHLADIALGKKSRTP